MRRHKPNTPRNDWSIFESMSPHSAFAALSSSSAALIFPWYFLNTYQRTRVKFLDHYYLVSMSSIVHTNESETLFKNQKLLSRKLTSWTSSSHLFTTSLCATEAFCIRSFVDNRSANSGLGSYCFTYSKERCKHISQKMTILLGDGR